MQEDEAEAFDCSALRDLRALVVDDDRDVCENTARMLEDIGMRGEWVLTGAEAVEKAASAHRANRDYHSVIVDWKMPGMDGLETARRIRGIVGDEVPIIVGSALGALNGNAEDEQKIRDLMKAVDEYVPTPQRDTDKPFLMPVEDVFTITGRGTVATGRVERGTVKVGDAAEIVGLQDEPTQTVITGVEMFRKTLDQAMAGDNIGALLRGIDRTDIERGQVLAKTGTVHPHTESRRRYTS